MSGFTENKTPDASGRPGRTERFLTWNASAAMLPLVGRIAADLAGQRARLERLLPEQARLERLRHGLAWPQRARRYQLAEEIAAVEGELQATRTELEGLGLAVLDEETGLVGFPTLVNDRRAYFSWRPGEASLGYWNYAGDRQRRPVPAAWTRPVKERAPRNRPRSERK